MKGENIAARLLGFGAGVVRLCRRLTEEAARVTASDLAALIREADELVAILTASIKTARQRHVTSCGEERSWRTRDGGEPGGWCLVAPSE